MHDEAVALCAAKMTRFASRPKGTWNVIKICLISMRCWPYRCNRQRGSALIAYLYPNRALMVAPRAQQLERVHLQRQLVSSVTESWLELSPTCSAFLFICLSIRIRTRARTPARPRSFRFELRSLIRVNQWRFTLESHWWLARESQ